jgi:hypothetical protein
VITAPLVVLGQVLGFAFATGLNLYATIFLVGTAARLGWIASLPPTVQGIENTVVMATAAVLYFVEFLIDKIPYADTVWDVVHTVIRPVAAALLVSAALAEASLPIQIGGAALAGATALGAHGLKAGLRLILNIRPKKMLITAISILEDVSAVALAIAVLMYPVVALVLAACALPIILLVGPRLWRVGVLAARAMIARFRGFFGHADWRGPDELPSRLRSVVSPTAPGRAQARVARAAFRGLKGVSSYRNGWVVLCDGSPVFVYQSLFRPRSMPLPVIEEPHVHRGVWTETVDFKSSNSNCTLFLLKDGPPAEVALAEFRAARRIRKP